MFALFRIQKWKGQMSFERVQRQCQQLHRGRGQWRSGSSLALRFPRGLLANNRHRIHSYLRLRADNLRRLDSCTGKIWCRINPDASVDDLGLKCRDLFREWRRRCPSVGQILIAMPWAGHAAVNDLPLSERAVLVTADV